MFQRTLPAGIIALEYLAAFIEGARQFFLEGAPKI